MTADGSIPSEPALIELDADLPDQLAILLVVAVDEAGEICGRQDQRLEAARDVELFGEIGPGQELVDLGAQRGDDRLRRARRREQAEPDVDREPGIELADGRQVGEALGAILPTGRQSAQLRGLD